MGVVNVTPDSFSDGGLYLDVEAAVRHARDLIEEGAEIVDVGGESTRPRAEVVPVALELERVIPVVERLNDATVSIDTRKLEVAEQAIQAGARIVNDVSAFRHAPEMAGLVASSGAGCCLMHMLGDPKTMQDDPVYDDVVDDVKAFLEERLAFAVSEGVPEDKVWLDPGIGFGKTVDHNLELLRRLDELAALGRPLLVGISRKRSLGRLLGDPDATTGSEAASIGAAVAALLRGATIFRVHDVRPHVEALTVAAAV
jgi:dihydropteroate synthase